MFESALATERALGLDLWSDACPPVEGIALTVAGEDGGRAIEWAARLDAPAQSVDQRLKLAGWLQELEGRGGRLVVHEAGVDDLERYASEHELLVVATGKGSLGGLFTRDSERSPYAAPQRALALTYVRGLAPRPVFSAVSFNLVPGVGEYFVFPALTVDGPCEIMVFEGIPGGPMDCWDDVRTPAEHLARSLEILERFLPWEHERARGVELTDANGVLTGRFAPTVRRPVAHLPTGAPVLAMADAAVLNDPVTGQGSNNAAKCAEIYLERILARGRRPVRRALDAADLRALLARLRAVGRLLDECRAGAAAAARRAAARRGPGEPRPRGHDRERLRRPAHLLPLVVRRAARRNGWSRRSGRRQARGIDLRELRNALGQFATGVTVVTTRAEDGRPVGVTANSFTSLSLEPPLVLWCLARDSTSLGSFHDSTHFGVSVLASSQHHLSRLFATSGADKFGGERGGAGRAVGDAAAGRRARAPRLPQRPPDRRRRSRDRDRRGRALRDVPRRAARLPLRLLPGHDPAPRARPAVARRGRPMIAAWRRRRTCAG